MAYRLKHQGSFWVSVALVFCALSPSLVLAQTRFADPTQPPGAVSSTGEVAEQSSERALQSVIIPKRGKPVAVIGGKEVRLGEEYGDSRLIKLTEREAVLEGPSGKESLFLTPNVEIKRIYVKKSTARTKMSAKKPIKTTNIPSSGSNP